MVDRSQIFKGIMGHIALLVVNFCVFVAIIESLKLLLEDLPLLNMLVLLYVLIHTIVLLSVQLGIQFLELIRIRMPTFLISYYFQFQDDETIPIPLLDPTKSKLAVLIILLVIGGGPILYPIFAVYGFLLAYTHLSIIWVDPSTILHYFEIFLSWMSILLIVSLVIVVLSIIAVEFKHL